MRRRSIKTPLSATNVRRGLSEWGIELPADPSKGEPTAFDYVSITDVVLSIRYSARDGGEELKKAAMGSLVQTLQDANAVGAARGVLHPAGFPSGLGTIRGGPGPNCQFLRENGDDTD